jgi:hypothetical protein
MPRFRERCRLNRPISLWAKRAVDEGTTAAGINGGTIFRRVNRLGKIWGDRITPKAIWHVVRAAAKRAEIKGLAPHDLRRYARGYVIWQAESLSKFNSCLGTYRLRQLSDIWAASRTSNTP